MLARGSRAAAFQTCAAISVSINEPSYLIHHHSYFLEQRRHQRRVPCGQGLVGVV